MFCPKPTIVRMKNDNASTIVRYRVAANIRNLREARNHSQSNFAKMVSINRSYYNQVENGEQNITVDMLVKIADGLDVPVAKLFQGLEDTVPRNLAP